MLWPEAGNATHRQVSHVSIERERQVGKGSVFLPCANPGFHLCMSSSDELTMETAEWHQVVGFFYRDPERVVVYLGA